MRLKKLAICLAMCLIADKQLALAMSMPDMVPEIVASSWDDNDAHYACITVNGKELLRFKGTAAADSNGSTSISVEEKAEDIAAKLDQLVKNRKFYADRLYPVRTKDGVVLRMDSVELFKLSKSDLANYVEAKSFELEYGLKIANMIREAFGAKALPLSFLKLAEATARLSVDRLAAVASAGVAASGHFSGNASWYGPHFHGRKCSDGTIFNQNGLTAAHRSLPFGTKLLVMNRRTGDSCVVKVNDRGPFIGGRVIDLSKGAARQLNMLGSGVAMVDCIVLADNSK